MQEMIPQASDHEPVLEIELKPFAGRDMLSELRRHNRELKKSAGIYPFQGHKK